MNCLVFILILIQIMLLIVLLISTLKMQAKLPSSWVVRKDDSDEN